MTTAPSAPTPLLRFCLGDDLPTILAASTVQIQARPPARMDLIALKGPVEARYERDGAAPLALPPALFAALKIISGKVTSAEVNPQLAPLGEDDAIALCAEVTSRALAAGFRLDPNVTIADDELPFYLGEPGAALAGGVRARRLARGNDTLDVSIRRQESPPAAIANGAPRDWFLVRAVFENEKLLREALAAPA